MGSQPLLAAPGAMVGVDVWEEMVCPTQAQVVAPQSEQTEAPGAEGSSSCATLCALTLERF